MKAVIEIFTHRARVNAVNLNQQDGRINQTKACNERLCLIQLGVIDEVVMAGNLRIDLQLC